MGQARYCLRMAKDVSRWTELGVWLDRAVAQGESEALREMANHTQSGGYGFQINVARSKQLLLDSALLGDWCAQMLYSRRFCAPGSVECIVWLRRAAMQEGNGLQRLLREEVVEQVELYEKGGSGRVVYEIGSEFDLLGGWGESNDDPVILAAGKRAVALFEMWREAAKRAVLCWLWLARMRGVPKDIRVLIADLIWEYRAAWGETTRPGTAEPRRVVS